MVEIQTTDTTTGEIFTHGLTPRGFPSKSVTLAKKDQKFHRAKRYLLKSAAAEILPGMRVYKCMNYRISKTAVSIRRESTGKCYFSGLMACGSVWTCPVCAAKIAERRRIELAASIEVAKTRLLHVSLATFTIPHGIGDDLPNLLKKFSSAWDKLHSGRNSSWKKNFGIVGTIRALEVTYGSNGWHPHLHVLFFSQNINQHLDFEGDIRYALSVLWTRVCVSSGLAAPDFDHGVDVRDGSYAALYVGKWGLDQELTKTHIKEGRNGSRTPWDLLQSHLDGDSFARRLFQTYAQAFKGKRQLVWSNGLKALLSLPDSSTDEQLAQQEVGGELVHSFTSRDWSDVVLSRSHSLLLDLAEVSNQAVIDYLQLLRHRKKPHNKKITS